MNYFQKKGCTMGTKYAPNYENVFVSSFEEKFIFLLLTNFKRFLSAFYSHIFLIWNGTKTEFDNFFEKN